jgi:hypothetical protein
VAAFDRLLAEARAAAAAPAEDAERPPSTLPVEWVEDAAARFRAFSALAGEFDRPRTLADWLAWLDDWLARDPWQMGERLMRVPPDAWEAARLDLLAWQALRPLLADWLGAERQWPAGKGLLSAAEFLPRLRAMLEGDAVVWVGPARGVQVAEALAASHRAFDHLFLVGMNAGRFPRRAPSSLLLGERDREALRAAGLPIDTTTDWDARERGLFRTLVAGAARTLTVSYVSLDETGADAIPSGFVEPLVPAPQAEGAAWRPVPFPGGRAIASHAHRTARIERIRATGRLSPWNGGIEEPSLLAWLAEEFGDGRTWSPTRIEEYAKCPWAWFSARLLRLERREDPDGDMDPRARGSVLHDALQRFYEAAAARAGSPVFLTPDDAPWAADLIRQSLREALAEAGPAIWLGHPSLLPVKQAELERLLEEYLAFELDENRKARDKRGNAGKTVRTGVNAHEVAFEDLVLEREGVRLRFRGRMDRVESGADHRAPGAWVAAVDYKTTRYACPGAGKPAAWDDGVVVQLPLYAWALGLLHPEARVARVEYRAIRQAERVHPLWLFKVSKQGVTEDAEGRARLESALTAVVRHVRGIRAGAFPARPAPSCGCPPFCHGWDVCRVRGGPQTGRN